MENKQKEMLKTIIIIILIIAIIGICFLTFKKIEDYKDKETNKTNVKEESNKDAKEENDYESFLKKAIENRQDEVITNHEDDYEIRITKDGKVIANVKADSVDEKAINDEVIETNVVKYFLVRSGGSDIGDIRILFFIKEDGKVTSIALDELLINRNIKINDNYDFKNITEIYDKEVIAATEYEPAYYEVFAKDIDNKETNIIYTIKN